MTETLIEHDMKINGVGFEKNDKYSLCHISHFSDELKDIIRKILPEICYGVDEVSTGRSSYSYKATLKEFMLRYEKKTVKAQKGLIGELLAHILIRIFFSEFSVASLYFNTEERSVKKGFDVILVSDYDKTFWITEIKSGELHKDKNSNQTMNDLVGTAKNDLVKRLNSENRSLWINAISGAKDAISESKNWKKSIINILRDTQDASVLGKVKSNEMNTFLTGVLFNDLKDLVSTTSVEAKTNSITVLKEFKTVYVLSIQKETYSKIYDFLKKEV